MSHRNIYTYLYEDKYTLTVVEAFNAFGYPEVTWKSSIVTSIFLSVQVFFSFRQFKFPLKV